MKKGKSIVELAQELQAIRETSKDFVVPVAKLEMEVREDKTPALTFTNGVKHSLPLTNWAHSQLAGYADIPKGYYDRIASENPVLLADSVNHGLSKVKNDTRLIRSVNGNARAVLSSRYRRLDSFDLVEEIFPKLLEEKLQVVSSEITETRLFLKALSPRIQSEVTKGDVVQYGLVISNSDVGAGSVRIEPLIYRLVCSNGLIADTAIRKYHIGKSQGGDDIQELLSDRTKELTDAAFWAQVRDIVTASMRPDIFEKQVDRLRVAAGLPITNFDLPSVVELAMKATGVTGEGKKNSILAALASGNEGAGLTQWGLVNSFTRAAQAEEVSYEESIELERAGSRILELSRNQWETIAA
jgi:hypothetical protein